MAKTERRRKLQNVLFLMYSMDYICHRMVENTRSCCGNISNQKKVSRTMNLQDWNIESLKIFEEDNSAVIIC